MTVLTRRSSFLCPGVIILGLRTMAQEIFLYIKYFFGGVTRGVLFWRPKIIARRQETANRVGESELLSPDAACHIIRRVTCDT